MGKKNLQEEKKNLEENIGNKQKNFKEFCEFIEVIGHKYRDF